MANVISIGSALVDIFITSDSFNLQETSQGMMLCHNFGDKVEVDSFEVHTGGGGSNTAIGFSRMGFNAALVSELGTDTWAKVILQDLIEEKVDTSLLIQENKEQTGGSVIMVATQGGRTVMVHRGAASMLDHYDIPEVALANADWIHLASISGQLPTLQKIFSVIAQSKRQFSWNPGKAELELLASGELKLAGLRCSVLFVNLEEWAMLKKVVDSVWAWAELVVVTNGAEGGQVWQDGKLLRKYSAKSVVAVNETGAGDSFVVGFVSGMLMGHGLQECVEIANINAASVIQQTGAKQGLLTREQLLAQL